MIFRCRNCGGNVIYDPDKKSMYCPHCESIDSEELVADASLEVCTNCGAPMILKEHTSATKCPSCGTYTIISDRVTGMFQPEIIIPFKIGKDSAKEILRDEFGKRPFTPEAFLSRASIDKMEGTYVPFFMYDYHSDMDYHAVGTKVRTWSDSKYNYTETSYYDVIRQMNASFEKVPVDASVEMDDGKMDLLEPYNYGELEPHQDKFLSGFYSEKYNMGEASLTPRAEAKVRRDSHELIASTVGGYATLTNVTENINLQKKRVRYALLPVWEYIFNFQGKDYQYHVNGQTGKVLGITPVSKGRVIAYGFTVFGMLTLIGFMIRMALSVM